MRLKVQHRLGRGGHPYITDIISGPSTGSAQGPEVHRFADPSQRRAFRDGLAVACAAIGAELVETGAP